MADTLRRLGPGDESILKALAIHDADYDIEDRSAELKPLGRDAARDFLASPAVLFWGAFDGETPVGFLQCFVLPLRAGPERELLLYEIGVHKEWRRRGIGRALLDEMTGWMNASHVAEAWVLADNPTAVEFYKACGFATQDEMSTYMVLSS